MPQTSPRNQLIAIQRRIVRRLREELYRSVETPPAGFLAYQRRYEYSVRSYRSIISRSKLLRELEHADVVFQGDFHTLPESQRAGLRLLVDLYRQRQTVLVLEAIHREHQAAVDDYVTGQLTEDEFLRIVEYEQNWGFPWRNYRPFFELAKRHGMPIYGGNAHVSEDRLYQRDVATAEVVVQALLRHPGALVYTIVGEFHVCRAHLPGRVEELLTREVTARRIVLLHQNVDSFYWDLARKRLEHHAEVLDVAPDEFCIMNSTPVAKYQSYFHWEMGQDDLLEGAGSLGGLEGHPSLVAEELRRIIEAITGFLGIEDRGFDDFTVYTSSDLDFLEHLREKGTFRERELREIRRQILNQESYFIPRGNIIYLASLSVDHGAEEATHYVNSKLAGYLDHALPARADFYYRVLREALGFFGSKVVNHLRFHYDEAELRAVVDGCRGCVVEPAVAPLLDMARFVIQHLDTEREFLATGRRPRLRAIYHQDVDLHLGITHALGYILGHKLYRGLLEGAVDGSDVRALFYRRLEEEGEAEELYFELLGRVADPGLDRGARAS